MATELKKQDVVYTLIEVIDVPFDQKEKTKKGIVAAATSNGFVWLKPIKDVYVLTEDELIEFSKRICHDYREGSEGLNTLKQFIKSITK